MKKTLFAALLLLGMSIMFASCEKTGTERTLVGCWVEEWEELDTDSPKNFEGVVYPFLYCEFTKSGLIKEFNLYKKNGENCNNGSGYFDGYFDDKNGVLYSAQGTQWRLYNTQTYTIKEGFLAVTLGDEYAGYIGDGYFEIINKDKIRIDGNVWHRVKKFSTK